MKDEMLARIEALKLTLSVPGLMPSGRLKAAHEFEQYILNGYAGEAPPAPQASDEVPGTEGKDPPKRRAKGASQVPDSSGEASETEQEGESHAPKGRPSQRAAGFAAT